MQRRLAIAEARGRERDRALAEERARANAAEAQVDSLRATLSFGLGQVLVESMTLKGALRLPRRILELRQRQAVKRGRAPRMPGTVRPADAMVLAGPAIERARADGWRSAADWLARQEGTDPARSRALAEVALFAVADDPAAAAGLGDEAVVLFPAEPRLFALAVALHAAGMLLRPAALLDRLDPALLATDAAARIVADIRRDAAAAASVSSGIGTTPPARTRGKGGILVIGDAEDPRAAQVCAAVPARIGPATAIVRPGEGSGTAPGGVHLLATGSDRDGAAAQAAAAAGIPVVVDLATVAAETLAPQTERGALACARLARLVGQASRVVARSPALARLVAEVAGVEPVLLPAAAPPVATVAAEDRLDLQQELELPAGAPVVLCPGPLSADPGLFALADALFSLPLIDDHAAVLVLLGDGPAGPALAARAARRGAPARLRLAGRTAAADRAALLSMASLVVFPRVEEQAIAPAGPIELAAALRLGRPVLASLAELAWAGGALASGQAHDGAAADLSAAVVRATGLYPIRASGDAESGGRAGIAAVWAAITTE